MTSRRADLAAAALPTAEDPDYLSRQLITCLGNKRALLEPIGRAVEQVKRRLDRPRLRCADLFSGSGVVSRLLKAHSALLIANDLEPYAAVIGRCYLSNRSAVDREAVQACVELCHARVDDPAWTRGFIEELYAPRDAARITAADRVFYTPTNARRLDNYRRMIADAPAELQDFLLGPLLSAASVHANTAGVFKGFYKDRRTGIGRFGGSGADALLRILGEIVLTPPVLSRFECEWEMWQGDANAAAERLRGMDLVYLDPPYNQHPYGSNYFMLNLLARYERPSQISRVSGIPADWQRSGYNARATALPLLRELVERLDSTFLLISYNNEGFIAADAMHAMLTAVGAVQVVDLPYTAFRGSRNLANRSVRVTERLFLVEKR